MWVSGGIEESEAAGGGTRRTSRSFKMRLTGGLRQLELNYTEISYLIFRLCLFARRCDAGTFRYGIGCGTTALLCAQLTLVTLVKCRSESVLVLVENYR